MVDRLRLFGCLLAVALVGAATTGRAQFTPGSLAISVIGDGGTFTTGSANKPIRLVEYSTGGAATGFEVTLPIAANGANQPILGTSGNGWGFLKQSVDRNYLSIIGYGATVTGSMLTIARIDAFGGVDTTTSFKINGGGGPTPRSAITSNGTDFWWSASAGSTNFAGVRYLTLGGSTTGVAVGNAANGSPANGEGLYPVPLNMRVLGIFNGQLYGSAYTPMSPTGVVPVSFRGVFTIGSGTPTTGQQYGQMLASGSGGTGVIDSPWEFYVANESTIYVADDDTTAPASGGLQKWVKNTVSGSWSKIWSVVPDGSVGMRGLTGVVSGSSVHLFGITAMTSDTDANSLVTLSDTFDGAAAPTFTTLAVAQPNYIFRGVAFTPVPEPVALGLGIGGLATLVIARRIRRKRFD